LKCHRLGEQGERIGPELTGVGGRFSRIHIVESILEPSRTIAPSFMTLMLVLKNGKTLSGVKVAETETTLTLADNQGQKYAVAKTDIEQQQPSPVSSMPEGLEKRFTQDEFVDLIAFLMSQKESREP
jgi:putative heme-binding domain-containing protein